MPLLMAGDSLARNGGLNNPLYFPAQPSRAIPLSEPSFTNIVPCNEWKRSAPFALVPSAYPLWQNMLPIIRLQQLSLGTKYPNAEKKSLDVIYPNLAQFTTFNPSPSISKHQNGQNNNPSHSFTLPIQQSNARLFGKHSIEKHVEHQINNLILRPDLEKPNATSPARMTGRFDKVVLQGQGKCNQMLGKNEHSSTMHKIGDLQIRKRSSSWPVDMTLKKKFLRKSEDSQTHSYENLEMDVANILVSDIPIPVVGFNSKENSTELQHSVKLDSGLIPHSSDSSVDSDNSSQSDRENFCNNKSKTGTVAFTCQQCAVTYETTKDLISHEAKHTTNNFTFSCNVCTQVFRSTNGLQKHVEFHADDEHRYNCSFCFKPFGSKEGLEEHIINMHMSKRPHKCTYCPKAFRDPGSLQKHVRVHTGEKPYQCNACEKSFAEYSSLRKHLRVHTGEQPYKCRFCPKAFSISGNLQRHILIHTGERPYKCSDCTKAFNNPSHLRRHIKNLHSKLENQK